MTNELLEGLKNECGYIIDILTEFQKNNDPLRIGQYFSFGHTNLDTYSKRVIRKILKAKFKENKSILNETK